jgi:integrase/recombinase XerD
MLDNSSLYGDYIMSGERSDLCGINQVEPHSLVMHTQELVDPQSLSERIPTQAESDVQLIRLWIHNRSRHTIKGYLHDIKRFRKFISKSLKTITLQELQDFADHLTQQNYAPNTTKRILSAVKSLFSFGHRIGYLRFDTGKPLRVPTPKETVSERILSEKQVHQIFDSIQNPRDRLLVKTLYYTGLRVGEISGLTWRSVQERENSCQITVQTKGSKTNVILLCSSLWNELIQYRKGDTDDSPIFRSRKGSALCVGQIQRIIKKIACKIGLSEHVSPHWFRHSHASHAIDNGCPLHLVQKQLNHSNIATTGKYLHARPQESSSNYLK